jgi:IclR family acetate operon transcriptional repressor
VEEFIAHGLESYSESTPAEPNLLRAELERVRADGYAVNRNQYRPDVCALAAAILDENGTPLAAVAVSMPDSRYDAERLTEWGQLVADTAAEIAGRRMGT